MLRLHSSIYQVLSNKKFSSSCVQCVKCIHMQLEVIMIAWQQIGFKWQKNILSDLIEYFVPECCSEEKRFEFFIITHYPICKCALPTIFIYNYWWWCTQSKLYNKVVMWMSFLFIANYVENGYGISLKYDLYNCICK